MTKHSTSIPSDALPPGRHRHPGPCPESDSEPLLEYRARWKGLSAFEFSPDSRYLAISSKHRVQLVDVRTAERRWQRLRYGEINAVAFSSDGRLVAIGTDFGTLILQATIGRKVRRIWPWPGYAVHGLAFSPDGLRLATSSPVGVRILDVTTGQKVLWKKIKKQNRSIVFNPDGRLAESVAFSPDGERFATPANEEGIAGIWDASTGELLVEVGNVGRVTGVAFSPDGRLLASSADDGIARTSDARTGRFLLKVRHGSRATAVAFSPDSRLLATSSDDGSARIWDASTGQQQCCLPHDDYVGQVAFSPDGKYLATSSRDGTIRIWDERARWTQSASRYRSLDVPDDAPADPSPAPPDNAGLRGEGDAGSVRSSG